jgi:hypothetical protein
VITLQGGNFQGYGGAPLLNGSIAFQLNLDAQIIASPGGQVPAAFVKTFQLDSNGNIQIGAKLYSNAELNPRNAQGFGTVYLVTVYDANGARLSAPMLWIFPEANGATVDISNMTPVNVPSF